MTKPNSIQIFLPVLLVGFIDGLTVLLSTFFFMLGKGYTPAGTIPGILLITIIMLLLFSSGAYFTYREENSHNKGNKLLRIYHAIDVNEELMGAMTKDVEQENAEWQEQWDGEKNASRSLGAGRYALIVLAGILLAGLVIIVNTFLPVGNRYLYLVLPVLAAGAAGFVKYILLQKSGWTGLLFIAAAAVMAALGAYWVAGLF